MNSGGNDPIAGESIDPDRASGQTIELAEGDLGDTTDLAEAERLDLERRQRAEAQRPDLPDRAFERITPQV